MRGSLRMPRVPEECPQVSALHSAQRCLLGAMQLHACAVACSAVGTAACMLCCMPHAPLPGSWPCKPTATLMCNLPACRRPATSCCAARLRHCSILFKHMRALCPLQEACDLMMRCLAFEPGERPSAAELLQELARLKRRNSLDAAAVAEWAAAGATAANEHPGTLRRCASIGASPKLDCISTAAPESNA